METEKQTENKGPCFHCGKTGHSAVTCWYKDMECHSWGTKAYKVTALLGQPVKMEIDTGVAVSLVSDVVYSEILNHLPLKPTDVTLKTYTGESVTMKGLIQTFRLHLPQKSQQSLDFSIRLLHFLFMTDSFCLENLQSL
ncbi:putative protein K02A2.6-like protein [Labeo rohita]|uniref:CCHC-type domain-containing protein n=1 Tax=Labeo rohita TaxID=84645 RepID=A0A498MRD1_LABRO|nr:putative protein K02A2.6-like protein [Labeo rohita]